MSIIGPRPGLWNQDVLTAERDKYGANDVKPGLTGWAQINGRDELEIPEKAKLDGYYVQNMGFKMDAKVFLRSVHVFGKDESVVEGGTGEMKKQSEEKKIKKKILVICQYYKPEPFRISDICEEMVRRGHEVHVVTGYPNYPEGIIYEGYGKGKYIDEVVNGVKIHRCYTIPRETGIIKRMLNYYSYGRENVPEQFQKYAVRIGNDFDVKRHGLKARLLDGAGFGSKRVTEKFIKWVKEYDPDIIHLHNIHGYYINIEVLFRYLQTCGKKIIWTLHDCWSFTGHCVYFDYVNCNKWEKE